MSTDTIRRWIDDFNGVKLRVDVPLRGRSPGTYALLPGMRHLNGSQSLTFAFGSSPYDTDISDQLLRQQSLFTALMHHDIAGQDLIKLPQVVNSMGGSIRTNFPYDQIPDLAHDLASVSATRTSGHVIGTTNGTASPYRSGGRTMFLPDHQRIRSLAQRLFPVGAIERIGQVAVLNGSGVQGQATSLALWLQQSRIHIGNVGSAPSYSFKRTQVWLAAGASPDAILLAKSVAALLQVPVVRHAVAGQHADVAVVIGEDFQDPTQQ